jgi:hypothetical protein
LDNYVGNMGIKQILFDGSQIGARADFFVFDAQLSRIFAQVIDFWVSHVNTVDLRKFSSHSASRTRASRLSTRARSCGDSMVRSANSAIHCTCSRSTRRRLGLAVRLAMV